MHIHTSPDVSPRKCSDIGLARRLQAAGMGGALVKSHGSDTAPRAALLNEQFPELFFAGGIVLNRQAGGLNPFAVRACGKMGGRFVWFPTMDSLSYQQFHHKDRTDELPEGLICLLDDNGEVKKEVKKTEVSCPENTYFVAASKIMPEKNNTFVKSGTVKQSFSPSKDEIYELYTCNSSESQLSAHAMVSRDLQQKAINNISDSGVKKVLKEDLVFVSEKSTLTALPFWTGSI